MNIAVDIDDTLTNSFDYFLPFVAEYFGADEKELKERNISYSNLPEEWKKDEINFTFFILNFVFKEIDCCCYCN